MIVVTGATGHLGQHVIRLLLEKVSAAEVAAVVRNPEKAAGIAAKGVQVRKADYGSPATLETALQGADKVLLISGSEVGQRAAQHQAVIDAAKKAGVKHLVYTSVLHAETTQMKLAAEHQYTEKAIRALGIPYTFLRDGWYVENYTDHLAAALAQGAVFGATNGGRIGAATRADFAAAAVAVLTGSGHENKAYELAGSSSFTLAEYAAEISRQSGKNVVHTNMPVEAFEQALVGAGLPPGVAAVLADCDVAIARGELIDSSGDLERLIARPATPWAGEISAALARLGA